MPATAAMAMAIALASHAILVHGQCSGTTTVANAAHATALGQCTTYDGDVVIGQNGDSVLSVPGLSLITGQLSTLPGNALTSLTIANLVTVGEGLSIRNNDALTQASFPMLQKADSLDLYGLPNLTHTGLRFALTNVTTVRIVQTAFKRLNWVTLDSLSVWTVKENPNLNNITLTVTSANYIALEANDPGLRVALPNLQWVYNLSVADALDVSVPALTTVNSSAGFFGNAFASLSLPNLRTTGGTLMLWNNTALAAFNAPALTNVSQDLLVQGSPPLKNVDFPLLRGVEGDMIISGSMTSVSMPALASVAGNVFITSTTTIDCTAIDHDNDSHVFQGQYRCVGGDAAAGNSSTTGAASSADASGSGSSSSSGAAKGGIAAGVIVAVLLLSAAAYLVWRRRRRGPKSAPVQVDSTDAEKPASHDQEHEHLTRTELPTPADHGPGTPAVASGHGASDISEFCSSTNQSTPATERSSDRLRSRPSELEARERAELPGDHQARRFELDA